jgi:lipoprotein signal peptidase
MSFVHENFAIVCICVGTISMIIGMVIGEIIENRRPA